MQNFKNKLEIKWFHKIPIIGPMIYTVAFEMFLAKETIMLPDGRKIRGNVKKYKTIFNLSFLLVSLPFGIVFLVFKLNEHEWTWWALGVSLSLMVIQNSNPWMYKKLYFKGIEKHLKEQTKNPE